MENQKRHLVLATHNPHKVEEISYILQEHALESYFGKIEQAERTIHWQETGQSFEDNALIKAHAVARHLKNRHADGEVFVLADDSGLEVDALNGRPGIYSSRFAGVHATDEDNYRLLLEELCHVPTSQRQARFCCCLVYGNLRGGWKIFKGYLSGIISHEPRGAYGFGYDPVFWLPEQKRTLAELTAQEKNRISHRYQALVQWLNYLTQDLQHTY